MTLPAVVMRLSVVMKSSRVVLVSLPSSEYELKYMKYEMIYEMKIYKSPPGPVGLLRPGPHRTLPNPCVSFFFQGAAHPSLSFKNYPCFFSGSLSVSLKAHVAQLSNIRVCSASPKWIYILDFREAHSVVSLVGLPPGALVG